MFEYVVWVVLLVGLVLIYRADRKGINATAKRISTIIRANIESAKPIKKLHKKSKQHELDSWTAEFEGRVGADEPKHKIVRTWYAKVNDSLYPHFKCNCGYSDWHINTPAASKKAKVHVDEQNKAEELLRNNGGTHAW